MPIPSINSKRCCPISHANNTPWQCGISLLAGICKIGHINRFGHYELHFDQTPPPIIEELRLSPALVALEK
jgi:hypothetical protein